VKKGEQQCYDTISQLNTPEQSKNKLAYSLAAVVSRSARWSEGIINRMAPDKASLAAGGRIAPAVFLPCLFIPSWV
jgi:hypothetical protein